MSDSARRPGLLETAAALREVHRALVEAARADYEREHGSAGGPAALLRLLTEDPFFNWLHPLSELIVDLDSLLTQELLPSGTVASVRLEIDRLTSSAAPFWDKYQAALQRDPAVAMAHGRLKQALKALPEAGHERHDRSGWVAPRVHRKRGDRN